MKKKLYKSYFVQIFIFKKKLKTEKETETEIETQTEFGDCLVIKQLSHSQSYNNL